MSVNGTAFTDFFDFGFGTAVLYPTPLRYLRGLVLPLNPPPEALTLIEMSHSRVTFNDVHNEFLLKDVNYRSLP